MRTLSGRDRNGNLHEPTSFDYDDPFGLGLDDDQADALLDDVDTFVTGFELPGDPTQACTTCVTNPFDGDHVEYTWEELSLHQAEVHTVRVVTAARIVAAGGAR